MRAGKLGGEGHFLAVAVHGGNDGDVIGQIKSGFEGFRQPVLQVVTDLEAIHHHFNGVFLVLVQIRGVIHVVDTPVDACTDKALGTQLLEQVEMFAFLFADHWRQQHQFAAVFHGQHLIHHLADGLGGQRGFMLRAAGLAHPGEQQAQIVVDFGDGTDGGSRVMTGGFLLDGDSRAEPFDVVHIGFFHHRQELAGIGGEGLHIAALAFCVERVKGQ